jgi:hypothetical protein
MTAHIHLNRWSHIKFNLPSMRIREENLCHLNVQILIFYYLYYKVLHFLETIGSFYIGENILNKEGATPSDP